MVSAGVPGGAAEPDSPTATSDAIVHKKYQGEEIEDQTFSITSPIIRSKIHYDHVLRNTLMRETGLLSGNPTDVQGRVWCSFLRPNAVAHCHKGETWDFVRKIAYNDSTIILRYANQPQQPSRFECYSYKFDGGGAEWFIHYLAFGPVSSTAIIQNRAYLFTLGRNHPNLIYKLPIRRPDGASEDYQPPDPYRIDKPSSRYDYLCTSLHPDISQPKIAIGTQRGILVHDLFCTQGHGITKYRNPASPTLSIEWKSENVIVAGQQESDMHLYDLRARDICLRLRHKSAITRLKCVDGSRILLGGPGHLDMYDLRYEKIPHQSSVSEPWLHYSQYNNNRFESRDFDISPRLGLLAVMQHNTTELWNLWTGARLIRLLHLGYERGQIQQSKVVSFMRSSDHPSFCFAGEDIPEGLFLGDETIVREFDIDHGKRPLDLDDDG